jgi:hypothetical protein
VLHRVPLSGRTARARREAALALASSLAAGPTTNLHLAVGPDEGDGHAWIALADEGALRARLEALTAAGLVPDRLVPAALLLPAPEGEALRTARLGNDLLVRGGDFAGAVEPGMAEALGTGPHAPPLVLAPEALATAALPDLGAGLFVPPSVPLAQRRWMRPLLAGLAILALLLALVPAISARMRAAAEARAADTAVVALATSALGREAPADADAALAALRRAAAGAPAMPVVAPALAAAMAAVEPTPALRFAAASYALSSGLEIQLEGPVPEINAVARRLGQGPLMVRQAGDRLRIGAPRASAQPQAPALARLQEARGLAERLARSRAAVPGPAPARLQSALASVGVSAPVTPLGNGGAALRLDAVRPAIALPLIARIEAAGGVITRLDLTPNSDPSLALVVEIAP